MKSDNLKAYWAWAVVCVVWGTTYLAIRIGVEDLPPMLFAGFRWIIAGTILLTYFKLNGKIFPKREEVYHLAIIGIALLGIANGLVVFAEQWVPSGLTSLLITTIPFWIVGVERLVPNGPKINMQIIAGLLLGLTGVVIIFGSDLESLFNPEYFWGVISLFGAVAAWAGGSVYSKYKKLSVQPMMGAAVQMLIAGIAQTLVGLSIGELNEFAFTQNSFFAFAYLILFGSIISYTSYIYAIAHLPISFVSTYAYINPVIALFLGWLVLDEELNWMMMLAAVVILMAVAIVTKGSQKMKAVTPKRIPEEKS